MPGKFHYRNQSQRFDLYTFYALLTKCKIVELLDKDGHTPFDSDTMNDNVLDYALQIYKDILDNGILSYFDSDSFRHDSDGNGNNGWGGITRNSTTARVYEPLRKWLYAQSNNGGIDETEDTITSGFSRKYYTIPLSDSEGTIKHINVYSFMKRHFNRWITYDSFERYKLTANLLTTIQQDSDISNLFADQFIKACEEDSDLSRRAVEMYSNRLQSDSEIRQEIVKTAITALSGLTPGGDSDSARALTEVVSAVYETDSEVRNEFGDQIIDSLLEDSDQQNELRDIISNTELTVLNAPLVTARQVLPMDGDDTGNIGDSDNKWAFANFSTLRSDNTKIDNARKTRLIYIDDSEGILYYSTVNLSWSNDSEFVINRLKANVDSKFNSLRVRDLEAQGIVHVSNDSEQTEIDRLITNDNFKFNDSDGIIYRGRKLIAIDSDKFYDLLIENRGLYTIDSDGVRSTILDTPVKSEYSWFIGQRGDVYVIRQDSDSETNTLLTRKLVFTSDKVVDTPAELSRALGDVVTKDQIFNTWYRFSHDYNLGGSVFNYPAIPSELDGWEYNSSNDVIYTTINSTAFSGFVSSDAYDDFIFNSVVRAHYSLANPEFNDDDSVVTIIGFVTEGVFGQPGYREHTLSVIRTAGGFPMTDQGFGNVTWGLVYNYSQDDVRLLVNGTSLGSASTNITIGGNAWVDFPNGSKIFIRRKGDQITCYCSTMNDPTHTLDSDTEITWDLASDSDTLKFRGPVRYGYGAHSQNGSYWSDIFFAPDEGSYLHYLGSNPEFNSSSGGNVYQYDPDTVSWVMDSDLTVDNTAGERILHNANTHKTFYNDPISDTSYQIMTARKFSDVFTLPPLANEPDSDTLGRMGLRPGTFAMADGVSWDPGFFGGTAPYPVFYDGTAWYSFSLF